MAWQINITKHSTTSACGILRSDEAPAGRMEPGRNVRVESRGASDLDKGDRSSS